MNTLSIRQQLQNYLEVADDKKVKAMYIMMENEIKEAVIEYTDEFKTDLDIRYAAYKNGKAKMVTATESKRRINKLLSKRKVK